MEIGNVEAVLGARDTMSPVLVAAAQRVVDLREQLKSLGAIGGPAFEALNTQLKMAQTNFDEVSKSWNAHNEAMQSTADKYNNLAKTVGGTESEMKKFDDTNKKAVVTKKEDADASEKAAASNVTYGQSLNQVESIATRLIERLVIMAAIRGTFEFVKGLFEGADALVKMNEKFDISLEKLQQLKYAGNMEDVPFEKVSSAVDHLDKALGSAKMSTKESLESIGLSFADVFSMTPDARFDAIGKAIGAISDPMKRLKIETELLGTDALDPMLKKLGELEAAAPTMEDATVQGLHNTLTAYRGMWAEVEPILDKWIEKGQRAVMSVALEAGKTNEGTVIESGMTLAGGIAGGILGAPLGPAGIAVGATAGATLGGVLAYDAIKWKNDRIASMPHDINLDPNPQVGPNGDSINGAGSSGGRPLIGQEFIDSLEKQSQAIKPLTEIQEKWLGQLKQMNQLTADNAAKLDVNIVQFKEYEKQVTAAESAARKFAAMQARIDAAQKNLEAVGGSTEETLNQIPGEVVEAGKYFLRGGANPSELQLASNQYLGYQLTESQAEAIKKTQMAEDEAIRKSQEETQRGLDAAGKLWEEYYSKIDVEDQGSTERKLNAIDKWYNQQLTISHKYGDEQADYEAAAEAVAERRRAQVLANQQVQVERSLSTLQIQYDKYYELVAADAGTAADKQIAAVWKAFDEQVRALNNDPAARENEALWRAHYDVLYQTAMQGVQNIMHAHDPLWQAWKQGNEDMRQEWAKLWEKGLTDADHFVEALAAPLNDLNTMWKKMLSGLLSDWEMQFLGPIMSDARSLLGSIFGIGSPASGVPGAPGSAPGSFLSGGATMFGGGSFSAATSTGIPGAVWQSETNPEFADQLASTGYVGGNWALPGGTGIQPQKMSAATRYGGGAMMAATGAYEMYQNKGAMSDLMGGAETGMGIGTMIMPGIGTLVGGAVGAVAGGLEALFSQDHTVDDLARDSGDKFGQTWSSQLLKTIEANKGKFHDEVAGELASLPAIIAEHPIDLTNLTMYTEKTRDLFVMLAEGKMTAQDVSNELGQIFPNLAKIATDANGFLNDSAKELITLAQQFNLPASSGMQAYVTSQAGIAQKGMDAVSLATTYDVSGAAGKINDQLDSVNATILDLENKKSEGKDDAEAKIKDLEAKKARSGLTNAQQDQLGDLYEERTTGNYLSAKEKNRLGDLYDQRTILQGQAEYANIKPTPEMVQDVGSMAMGSIGLKQAQGGTYLDAVMSESTVLTQLEKEYKTLGMTVDDARLKQAMMLNDINQLAPTLIPGIQGLNQEISAQTNLNVENADTFQAQERIGYDFYVRMQSQVARFGGSTEDALKPMQGYLHSAQEAAEKLGIPLDENTQMMIDQSKQLGIWDANAKGAEDKTDKLAAAIERLVNWLDKIPANKDSTVTTHFKTDGDPTAVPGGPSANGQGTNADRPGKHGFNDDGTPDWDGDPTNSLSTGGVVYASHGRYIDFKPMGTDTVPAMLTEGEGIVSKPAMDRIGASGLAAVNGGTLPTGGGGGISSNKTVHIGGISIQVILPPGSNPQDAYEFGQHFAEWTRLDLGLVRTTMERVADSRIAAAAGTL